MRLGDGEEGVGGGFYKADGNMMKLNSGNKGEHAHNVLMLIQIVYKDGHIIIRRFATICV